MGIGFSRCLTAQVLCVTWLMKFHPIGNTVEVLKPVASVSNRSISCAPAIVNKPSEMTTAITVDMTCVMVRPRFFEAA